MHFWAKRLFFIKKADSYFNQSIIFCREKQLKLLFARLLHLLLLSLTTLLTLQLYSNGHVANLRILFSPVLAASIYSCVTKEARFG